MQAGQFTEDELNLARKHIRHQILHHTKAKGSIVDEFVEKMINITLSDTDNNHKLEDWTSNTKTLCLTSDINKKTSLGSLYVQVDTVP
jgi:ribosomal protein L17